MKQFITSSIKFILKNENVLFDSEMFKQLFGIAMGELNVHLLLLALLHDMKKKLNSLLKNYQSNFQSKNVD